MHIHIRRTITVATAAVALMSGSAFAQGKGHGKDKDKDKEHRRDDASRVEERRDGDRRRDGDNRDGDDRNDENRRIAHRVGDMRNGDMRNGDHRDNDRRDGDHRRIPPGLAKKPGGMPPGQYKKVVYPTQGASVLRDILMRRGYTNVRTEPHGQSQVVYYRLPNGTVQRAVVSPGADRLSFSNVPESLLREVLARLY